MARGGRDGRIAQPASRRRAVDSGAGGCADTVERANARGAEDGALGGRAGHGGEAERAPAQHLRGVCTMCVHGVCVVHGVHAVCLTVHAWCTHLQVGGERGVRAAVARHDSVEHHVGHLGTCGRGLDTWGCSL